MKSRRVRILVVLALLAIVAVVILSGSSPIGASCPSSEAVPATSFPNFRSSFESGDFREWGGYGREAHPEDYPPARVIDPLDEGVPRREGCKVARFEVTADDARVRRTHAKLLKSWKLGDGYWTTEPPSDVSASYRSWYYLPRSYRLRGEGWVNMLQFKEVYKEEDDDGELERHEDPSWKITLYGGRRGEPVAYLDNQDNSNDDRGRPFPRGRWVEVRADLRQRRDIKFFIDGRYFATATDEVYDVGVGYGEQSLGWTFGVGNYGGFGDGKPAEWGVSGPMYVDAVSVRPLD
jgi:hypothetical protein